MKSFTNADLVDAFNEGWNEGNNSNISLDVLEELFSAINQNRKVSAIKAVRTITNCGLKEAKDLIEKYFYCYP